MQPIFPKPLFTLRGDEYPRDYIHIPNRADVYHAGREYQTLIQVDASLFPLLKVWKVLPGADVRMFLEDHPRRKAFMIFGLEVDNKDVFDLFAVERATLPPSILQGV